MICHDSRAVPEDRQPAAPLRVQGSGPFALALRRAGTCCASLAVSCDATRASAGPTGAHWTRGSRLCSPGSIALSSRGERTRGSRGLGARGLGAHIVLTQTAARRAMPPNAQPPRCVSLPDSRDVGPATCHRARRPAKMLSHAREGRGQVAG